MQVERARELGLCYGVRRAVDMVREAVLEHGSLQTLGPLAHNRTLLDDLAAQGITAVSCARDITGPVVVVSAHGVPPDTVKEFSRRGITVIDTTCPIVAHAQKVVANMAQEGLTIVIFGDAQHSEVRGLLGWAGSRSIATLDLQDLRDRPSLFRAARVGIVSQTTQRIEDFAAFVQAAASETLLEGKEVRAVNTLCDATRRRQAAAAELAQEVDAMIVIGGRNSANTLRLAESCAAIVETHLVETPEEIESCPLEGKRRVGLTAGASTPDSSIETVESLLRRL